MVFRALIIALQWHSVVNGKSLGRVPPVTLSKKVQLIRPRSTQRVAITRRSTFSTLADPRNSNRKH